MGAALHTIVFPIADGYIPAPPAGAPLPILERLEYCLIALEVENHNIEACIVNRALYTVGGAYLFLPLKVPSGESIGPQFPRNAEQIANMTGNPPHLRVPHADANW